MQQCVRVLGFTDLRVEHILLLLCCYINYHDEVGLESAVRPRIRSASWELCCPS